MLPATPGVTAPGRYSQVTIATLAAPGTKASPDGSSMTADSTADADGTSASTIKGSLTASVDLGTEGGAQKVRFVDRHPRGLLTAGGLYNLRISHAWSHTGTFPITVKLSDGRVLVTSVTVRKGAPAQPTGPVVGPCDKPTISFPAGSTVRDDSRLSVSFTHLTPSTWVDVLTDGTKIGTVHTNATGSGNQDAPITYQTASGAHLLRIAGPDGRFVEKVFTVRSKTLPFSNAITRDVTATASSEASNETTPNGRAAAAVDGDPNTFWHSRWEAPAATYPHTLTVDLGRKYALSAMKWVSRRGNPNGRVKTLVLEFSSDGSQWGGKQPVTLPYSSYPTIIGLPRRADARYVRITMTSPHDASQPFAAVGEVTFAGLADGHADRPRHDPTAHMWTPPAHCSLPNPTPPGQPAMASTDSSTAASTGTTNHSQTGTRPTRLPATGR